MVWLPQSNGLQIIWGVSLGLDQEEDEEEEEDTVTD